MRKLTADNGTKRPRQSWTPILSSFFARTTNGAFIEYRGSFVRNSRRPPIDSDTIPSRRYRTIMRHSAQLATRSGGGGGEGGGAYEESFFYSLLTRDTPRAVSPLRLAYVSDPWPIQVKRRQLPFVLVLFLSFSLSLSLSLTLFQLAMAGPGRFITRNCYGLRSVPLATQVQYHFHNDASHLSLLSSRFPTSED